MEHEAKHYRATLVTVEDEEYVSMLFVDTGTRHTIKRELVKQLPLYISELAPLAQQLFLPILSEKACETVKVLTEMLSGKDLFYVKIACENDTDSRIMRRILLYTEDDGDVCKCLVDQNLGKYKEESYLRRSEAGILAIKDHITVSNKKDKSTMYFTAQDLDARLQSIAPLAEE